MRPTVEHEPPAEPRRDRDPLAWLRRTATSGTAPVWLLSAALLVGASWLYLEVVAGMGRPAPGLSLPWWVLAAGFLLAEVAVVHYDFRHEAHSFSMSELPLVFGLFFATTEDLVIGTVVGAGAALLLHRHQTGMKLLFNLGHFALGTCVAILVFHTVAGERPAFVASSWVAVLLATVATSALSTAAIFTAISLSERHLELAKLPEQLALALLTTIGSASLGLMGVGVTAQDPAAAWLLVVPVGTFFLAYRGYVLKRQERNTLEFLYHSARILDEAPDLATGMSRMLRGACRAFNAEVAQLALLSPHDGQLVVVVVASGETARVAEHVRLEDIDGLLHRAVQSSRCQILGLDPPVTGLDGHALRQVMLGPLRSDSQVLGGMLVGNRLGAAGAFKPADARLLETLVTQISVALENGRLAQTLTQTAERADRERQNALVLQRGILPPPLPQLADASVAVRYVPSGVGMEVGGDWYDVMQLPGGDIGVAIGDVLGHDLEAAARMGQARSGLRAYAMDGHPPAALMERLNRLLTQTDPEFMGTCCYLQLSPERQIVTLVSAGHPPPLLIDPHGLTQQVELDPNLPLGVDEAATFIERTVAMPPGATLVLYTDGLVESRALSLSAGLERIAQIPPRIGRGGVEPLADHLLAQAPPGPGGDDITLLLLRHEPAARPTMHITPRSRGAT